MPAKSSVVRNQLIEFLSSEEGKKLLMQAHKQTQAIARDHIIEGKSLAETLSQRLYEGAELVRGKKAGSLITAPIAGAMEGLAGSLEHNENLKRMDETSARFKGKLEQVGLYDVAKNKVDSFASREITEAEYPKLSEVRDSVLARKKALEAGLSHVKPASRASLSHPPSLGR